MKITRKELRAMINEMANPDPFRKYYANYTEDSAMAREMYQTFIGRQGRIYSEPLKELFALAQAAEDDLVANGVRPNLVRYLQVDIDMPIDRLTIHKMLKGEIPMDYEFIKRKMDNADSFATAMSSGKYGSLD